MGGNLLDEHGSELDELNQNLMFEIRTLKTHKIYVVIACRFFMANTDT